MEGWAVRYDRLWSRLARRALGHAEIDLQTMMDSAAAAGASDDAILEAMLRDLDNDGPVFGKLLRGLSGAAASTVKAAAAQGEAMGYVAQDEALRDSQALRNIEGSVLDAIERGDAEAGDIIETEVLAEVDHTWIATLINTCHLCLPLHGQAMPLREWRARNLSPETIHQEQGWESSCKCKLIPSRYTADYAELAAPLRRAKVAGSKRTVRAVTSADIDHARAAAIEAMGSDKGRATLRRLGQSGGE